MSSIRDLRLPNKLFTDFNKTYNAYTQGKYVTHVLQLHSNERLQEFYKRVHSSPEFVYSRQTKVLRVSSSRKAYIGKGRKNGAEVVDFSLFLDFADTALVPAGALGSGMKIKRKPVFSLAYTMEDEHVLSSTLHAIRYRMEAVGVAMKARVIKAKRGDKVTYIYGKGKYGEFKLAFNWRGTLSLDKSTVGDWSGKELSKKVKEGIL